MLEKLFKEVLEIMEYRKTHKDWYYYGGRKNSQARLRRLRLMINEILMEEERKTG